jgi:hypothetical protein
METTNDPICCTKFDPNPWDNVTFEWKDKLFVKGSVYTFFYLPLNFGSVIKKMDKIIRTAGANWTEGICLSDHTSEWNQDLYIAVDKDVPGLEKKVFTGKFYSKVYEGPYKNSGKWASDFEMLVSEIGTCKTKTYVWYTTCPKCAKKYGKNYVVMIAQL